MGENGEEEGKGKRVGSGSDGLGRVGDLSLVGFGKRGWAGLGKRWAEMGIGSEFLG